MEEHRTLPSGTVTFLFTDIEGSTRLLHRLGDGYPAVLLEHQRILREAFTAAGGVVFGTEGDAMFVAFNLAPQALTAAVEAQRALAAHDWPEGNAVKVRMGLHTGEAVMAGEHDYTGIDVHRAARIAAAAHGGQILLSEPVHALAIPHPPEGVSFRDLGEHRLKDLPAPEHLYQALAEGLEAKFPALRSVEPPRGNLPIQLTSFVGRRRELDDIERALAGTTLLTLTGPGGTGKTRLSLQVAVELSDQFRDGAYFVPLASITDPALMSPTLLSSLGVGEDPSRSPRDTLLEHLRGRQILLVLDNFEQIIPAADLVGEILATAPEVKVLVTSRERLHLHGEIEHPVPPLALPDPANLPSLEALSQFEAVALFVERARAVLPTFQVTNDNAPAVAEICARLDGLPLAIELAAARIRLLPPGAILKRLGDRLGLLSGGGARDLPARQQTLRDAIAWSYDLLTEPERRFFAAMSVFVDGSTFEAIEAVCRLPDGPEPFDGVESLVDKSLLRQGEATGESRLFMLETIREFAVDRLESFPDAAVVHARHAEHFLQMAQQMAPELLGPKQAQLLDALEREHGNMRAALSWAAASGQLPLALRLASSLWRFWQMRGHLREAAQRLDGLLALPDAERDPEALADALEAAGGVSYWMVDWPATERHYLRCLELRRSLGDRPKIAAALYNLSFVYTVGAQDERTPEQGRQLLEEAVEIFREVDDRGGQARALWAVSNIHMLSREWAEAADTSGRALELFLELDETFDAAWAAHSLGFAQANQGRFDEARQTLTMGLETFVAANDVTGISLLVTDFAVLEGLTGSQERGIRLWGAGVAASRSVGSGLVETNQQFYPELTSMLRQNLSEDEFRRLQAEGAAMSAEEAADYALRRPG